MIGETERVERIVAASPDRVFAAFVRAEAVAAWLPPPGLSAVPDIFEPRPGGTIRLTLAGFSDTHLIDGRFVEVEPWRRIVQRFAHPLGSGEVGWTTISWLLRPVEDGTAVTLLSDDPPPGLAPADHEAGLRNVLARLAACLEPRF